MPSQPSNYSKKRATPSFIVELPLVVRPADERALLARFVTGRRLYNAVLGEALAVLRLMRESRQWRAAVAMPKGKPGSPEHGARSSALKACIERFDFKTSRFERSAIAHKNTGGFADRLGAHESQKIAQRAFSAAREYSLGKRGRPRFKGKNRPLRSIESKTNAAGIRWKRDVGGVEWGNRLTLPAKLPSTEQDPYLAEALAAKTKYCRIVWRNLRGKRRWYVQLVQEGRPPAKYRFHAAGAVVGIDVGPSTIAIIGDEAVGLERFAPSVEQPWAELKRLQRAQDRSRREMNPKNYDEKGRPKKGRRVWKKSKRYEQRQTWIAEIERRLAAARKRDHGCLTNRILGLGTVVQSETLSYRALQKRFGRSVKVRAPGMFIDKLSRKAESAGGAFIELDTWRLRMSQYDHVTDSCEKKSLSQRWHRLGGGSTLVQRDCYSAFLAKHATGSAHNPARLTRAWMSAEPLLARAGLCMDQSASGLPRGSPTVAVPSERIARERELSNWSQPGCCSRKTRARSPQRAEALGTPWL